jgi:primosomal replication protein N
VENQIMLDGFLLKRGALRHTPAGIAAIDFTVVHDSMQIEAGQSRRVQCEVAAVAIGEMATTIATLSLNQLLRLTGFLSRRRKDDGQLTMHVTGIAASPAAGPIKTRSK